MSEAEMVSTGTSGSEVFGIEDFPVPERRAVYRAIYERRDIRHFRTDPIPDDALARIIQAAHHGPSVGFMQPWDFILIKDAQVRRQVKDLFEKERQAASCFFDEPRRSHYLSLKLEGIMEAPVNVCVTCDSTRADEVLGRNAVPEADVYSTCCAIQNLWLAARCEGIGVGWVSILKSRQLRQILGIPAHILPVAYLCLGYPTPVLRATDVGECRLEGAATGGPPDSPRWLVGSTQPRLGYIFGRVAQLSPRTNRTRLSSAVRTACAKISPQSYIFSVL